LADKIEYMAGTTEPSIAGAGSRTQSRAYK
jgi:hypothetical protein